MRLQPRGVRSRGHRDRRPHRPDHDRARGRPRRGAVRAADGARTREHDIARSRCERRLRGARRHQVPAQARGACGPAGRLRTAPRGSARCRPRRGRPACCGACPPPSARREQPDAWPPQAQPQHARHGRVQHARHNSPRGVRACYLSNHPGRHTARRAATPRRVRWGRQLTLSTAGCASNPRSNVMIRSIP
jgi:hypothetical protein